MPKKRGARRAKLGCEQAPETQFLTKEVIVLHRESSFVLFRPWHWGDNNKAAFLAKKGISSPSVAMPLVQHRQFLF